MEFQSFHRSIIQRIEIMEESLLATLGQCALFVSFKINFLDNF